MPLQEADGGGYRSMEETNMTGERIHQILASNSFTEPFFLGVFSSDTLPRVVLKRPSFLITNDQPSYQPGNHWIALFLPRVGSSFFFDSFGNSPSNPNIITFLNRNSPQAYDWNRKAFQKDSTATCGSFVIVAAFVFAKGGGLQAIGSLFKPFHQEANEVRVRELMQEIIK